MGVDQYPAEPPSAAAATLAAQRGIGEWKHTFATKQGWGWRKWRDWRLYFYTGGVIVTAPTGLQAAYDWKTARVMQTPPGPP